MSSSRAGLMGRDIPIPESGPIVVAMPRMIAPLGVALVAFGVATLIHARHGAALGSIAGVSGLLLVAVAVCLACSQRTVRAAHVMAAADREQLERMFTSSPLAMAVSDSEGRFLRVNSVWFQMLGYDEDELVGRTVAEITHPDDRHQTEQVFSNLRIGRRGFDYEKRYLTKDGREVWVQVAVSRVIDAHTGEQLMIGQAMDITERRRAEEQLLEERHLFDEFLKNIPEQVYFKDRDSRFLRVSRLQATQFGFNDPAELIGMTDADLFHTAHVLEAREAEVRIMETGQPILNLEEREEKDPAAGKPVFEQRWMLTSKMPLRDTHGEIVGTFGISRDITARKRAEIALSESEARWRALLANLQEIVMLVDENGRITFATPSIERWLGYPGDELVGIELAGKLHADDVQAVTQAVASVIPGWPVSATYRVRHHDGSWHTVDSTIMSMRDDPTVRAVLIVSNDVSERVRLEQEREQLDLERRVSQRLEAVGQLASGIAHEINTPLQFVGDSITFLRDSTHELMTLWARYRELLLLEQPGPLEQRRAIVEQAEEAADVEYLRERIPAAFERTADGVSRVRSIVLAMKRFSHPSTGEIEPEDINDAIETTLAVCRNEYKYIAELALELGELPLVPCSLGELNQVLLNLIVNAAQAIEEQRAARNGGPDAALGLISISTRVDQDQAVIAISDDGPGIPEHLLDRIYEPFFTTKEVGKGTGQGLAIARTTIARHGGTLECISAPGEGTTFTIRLPLKPPGPEHDSLQALPSAAGT